MSKFGELIDAKIPVLLDFYTQHDNNSSSMDITLSNVAASIGDKARVIKIDVDKNQELVDALYVQTLPTLIIYKNGQMKWRQSGEQEAHILIDIIQEYI